MVLINLKSIKILLAFIFMLLIFSCEEVTYLIDCNDCITEEPIDGSVEIRIDKRFISDYTINIYEGNLEDNILILTKTPSSNPGGGSMSDNVYTISLPLNKKYTVTAKYYRYGKYYIAVDAVIPRVKDLYDKCGETCYVIYDNICRLELFKY